MSDVSLSPQTCSMLPAHSRNEMTTTKWNDMNHANCRNMSWACAPFSFCVHVLIIPRWVVTCRNLVVFVDGHSRPPAFIRGYAFFPVVNELEGYYCSLSTSERAHLLPSHIRNFNLLFQNSQLLFKMNRHEEIKLNFDRVYECGLNQILSWQDCSDIVGRDAPLKAYRFHVSEMFFSEVIVCLSTPLRRSSVLAFSSTLEPRGNKGSSPQI